MDTDRPSRTAISIATFRAAHLLLDAEPLVLRDDHARALAGFDSDADLLRAFAERPAIVRDGRVHFVVRSRFAEDEVAFAAARGVSQYVILGAGLDSFALRQSSSPRPIEVFEVDRAGSQAWKRARMEALGVPAPAHLRYVAADLAAEDLAKALESNGFDHTAPTVFSCLGLTQYLEPEAVSALIADIAGVSARGSVLVVQFLPPPDNVAGDSGDLLTKLGEGAAKAGEPWLSFFEPAEMEALLVDQGFAAVQHFGAAEADERYLKDRGDALRLPSYFHMITASRP